MQEQGCDRRGREKETRSESNGEQWETDGETVIDFISLGSKITADGDHSHKIEKRLLLGRKVMINLDSILKRGGITLPTKICLIKTMCFLFPVVMNLCVSLTIKKAEH